jgi:glycogen synthase
MHNGMTADHSWTQPAAEYVEVYERVVTSRN